MSITALRNFRFVADPLLFRPEVAHVGRVPEGVSNKEKLMSVLKEALRFPEHFGQNWDALSDCLRDLSWLPPGQVALLHDAVPDLPSKDLRMYLDVLATAVGDYKPLEKHELVAIFPEEARSHVLDLA